MRFEGYFVAFFSAREVSGGEGGGAGSDAIRSRPETEAERGAVYGQPHTADTALVEPAEMERRQ